MFSFDLTSTAFIFSAASLCAFAVVFAVGCIMFIVHRDLRPIKQREPWIVLCGAVCLATWLVALLVQSAFSNQFDCAAGVFFSHICLGLTADFYTWRAIMLLFHYHSTQHKIKSAMSSKVARQVEHHRGLTTPYSIPEEIELDEVVMDTESALPTSPLSPSSSRVIDITGAADPLLSDEPWIFRHREFIVKYLWMVVSLAACLQIAEPFILIRLNLLSFGTKVADGCNFPLSNIALFLELLGYGSGFAVIGYLLSKAGLEDSLYIKAELKFCAIFSSVASIPWFCVAMIPQARAYAVTQNPIVSLYSAGIAFIMICVSVLYPVWIAMRLRKTDQLAAVQSTQTLNGVLSTPEGYATFEAFLAKEFSVENLLFWSEARYFKNRVISCGLLPLAQRKLAYVRLLNEAQQIWIKFLAPGSQCEINIPGHVHTAIQVWLSPFFPKGLKQVADPEMLLSPVDDAFWSDDFQGFERHLCSVFSAAEDDIFNLMNRDSFRRFLGSTLYTELCHKFGGRKSASSTRSL